MLRSSLLELLKSETSRHVRDDARTHSRRHRLHYDTYVPVLNTHDLTRISRTFLDAFVSYVCSLLNRIHVQRGRDLSVLRSPPESDCQWQSPAGTVCPNRGVLSRSRFGDTYCRDIGQILCWAAPPKPLGHVIVFDVVGMLHEMKV